MPTDFLLFADASSAFQLSWWMALIMFLTFIPWGWLVSSKLEQDARYFRLSWERWNAVHMACGAAALAAMLFIPIIAVGWAVGVIILGAPILVYWKIRNAAVPESQRFYLTGDTITKRLEQRKAARADRDALIQYTDARDRKRPVPTKEDPRFPIHMVSEDIIGPALDARASRIDVLVRQNGTAIAQMIDGVQYKREPIPADAGLRVVEYLKDVAGMDLEDRRRRQTGEFFINSPNGRKQISATSHGSSQGLMFRLDIDRSERLSKPFDSVGFLPSQLEAMRVLKDREERHGVVLCGAPRGQGLSTTGYALIGRHDAYTANIKTLEHEILTLLDGVDQVRWDGANPDVDFATNLQSILRRDPDVVLIDALEDTDTARIAAAPGMDGPLIYVLQPGQPNVVDQIRQWVKLVGDIKEATKALRAIINQRLVRTLCSNCRQAFTPTPEQLKKLNLPPGKVKQLFRAGGKVQVKNRIENCPICGGSGYLGQTGVFEVMVTDEEARRLLAGGDLKAALAHARRNKMIYLQEAALSKVISGETTIEEVIRVTAPPKSGGAGQAEPPRGQSQELEPVSP